MIYSIITEKTKLVQIHFLLFGKKNDLLIEEEYVSVVDNISKMAKEVRNYIFIVF